MTTTGEPIYAALMAQDDILATKGFPRISDWWRGVLQGFLCTGAVVLCVRCGRQGGKSTTMARVAVAVGVFVKHNLPPGTRGMIAFVSVRRSEAAERLHNVAALLDALEVPYRKVGDTIELEDRPIVFAVFTANFRTSVGMTLVAAFLDEMARWRDDESGANPAGEVVSSLMPAGVTQSLFRAFYVSSPLGLEDFHAETFARGDTDAQRVAFAPSWVANPTITEERTKQLEPDPRKWAREYAAIPQAGAVSAFDMEQVNAAIRTVPNAAALSAPIVALDSSAGRGDAFVWCSATWVASIASASDYAFLNGQLVPVRTAPKRGAEVLRVSNLSALEGKFGAVIEASAVVANIASLARRHGARHVHGDQFMEYVLRSEFANHRISYIPHAWTQQSKIDAMSRLRQWFRESKLAIEPGPEAEKLRGELASYEETITPSGAITYGGRRGKHDDRVAVLLTIAMTDVAGQIGGSPIARKSGCVEMSDQNFSWG